jgi:adenylate cyclase
MGEACRPDRNRTGAHAVFALFLIYPPVLVQQAELRIYDLMHAGRVSPPRSGVPVLVGIDEESLDVYGQWPWPRHLTARLVERLQMLGAKVVALDILMPEPDRTAPELVLSGLQHGGEPAVLPRSAKISDSNSLRLARSLSKGHTALGYFFTFTKDGTPQPTDTPVIPEGMVITRAAGSGAGLPKPVSTIRSIPVLRNATAAEGFTNAVHDQDGALRRVSLLMPYKDKLYPSLSLAALLLASNDRSLTLARKHDETELLWNMQRIPLDSSGSMLIDFRDEKNSFPYFSALSILAGTLPAGTLQGKIVLVGSWAKGLGDYHLVPSGTSLNGLAIHATIIDTILSNRFISRPGWARGAELFAVLLLGIVSTWLLSKPGFMLSLATVVLGSSLCYWGARTLFISQGLYLSPLIPMLTPVAIMTFLSLLKYGIEARKLRQRTRDLIEAQDTIIVSMSALTETRDKETGGHILRTRRYVEILARELATSAKYRYLDENSIKLLAKSAPLHDIGKVGISDNILNKSGQLSEEEYAIMKTHTLIGANAIAKTIGAFSNAENQGFLQYAREMIESHHERWDGSGYPHGLSGEEIPLAGRLMAVADVYDAMTSRRSYKQGVSHEKVCEVILRDSGKAFDPEIVAAFNVQNKVFYCIYRNFSDKS